MQGFKNVLMEASSLSVIVRLNKISLRHGLAYFIRSHQLGIATRPPSSYAKAVTRKIGIGFFPNCNIYSRTTLVLFKFMDKLVRFGLKIAIFIIEAP